MAGLISGIERQRDSWIAIARLVLRRERHPVIVADQSKIDPRTFHVVFSEGTVKDISRWSGIHVPPVKQGDVSTTWPQPKPAENVFLELGPVMADSPELDIRRKRHRPPVRVAKDLDIGRPYGPFVETTREVRIVVPGGDQHGC